MGAIDKTSAVRPSERRSSLRLYKCWDAARRGKPLPAIGDFDFSVIEDLRSHIFLLGLEGPERIPVIRYIGTGLTQEIGRDLSRQPLSAVPRPSLLAHVAYQYLRAVGKQQPVAVDGVLTTSADKALFHRGILLPFAESGTSVDAVLGSFRWRAAARQESPLKLSKTTPPPRPAPRAAEAPSGEAARNEAQGGEAKRGVLHAELRVALQTGRRCAEEALAGAAGVHRQLYRALAAARAFAIAAEGDRDGYELLLRESQIQPQALRPDAATVRLVFGSTLTKTQRSEYAAVLSLARRTGDNAEELERRLLKVGLKDCLRTERTARRGERGAAPAAGHAPDEALRTIPSLGECALAGCESGFVLLLARRSEPGSERFQVIAVDEDPERLAAAKRRAARGHRAKRTSRRKALSAA